MQYPGSIVNWDTPAIGCGKIQLSFDAWGNFEKYLIRSEETTPLGFSASRRLVTITFDPDIYEEHRNTYHSLHLLNHLNPFIKWITSETSKKDQRLHSVSAISLKSSFLDGIKNVPPGDYFFLIRRLSMEGIRKREKLLYSLYSFDAEKILPQHESEAVLNICFEHSTSMFPERVEDFSEILELLQDAMNGICNMEVTDFVDEMETKAKVMYEQTKSHFDRKIKNVNIRLDTMRSNNTGKIQGIRLAENQLNSLEQRRELELNKFNNQREPVTSMDNVCCGLLRVTNG